MGTDMPRQEIVEYNKRSSTDMPRQKRVEYNKRSMEISSRTDGRL
jgi:hypothetical protein